MFLNRLTVNERLVLCSDIATRVKAWYDNELTLIHPESRKDALNNDILLQYCTNPLRVLSEKTIEAFSKTSCYGRLNILYEHVNLCAPAQFLKELLIKQLHGLKGKERRRLKRFYQQYPAHLLNIFAVQVNMATLLKAQLKTDTN